MTPKPSVRERQAAQIPRVVIAWLSPGQVSHYFCESLSASMVVGYRQQWLHNVLAEWSSANVSSSRNTVTARFLDETDADWLLWVDSDMRWDANSDIQTLLTVADPVERPIVGGLAFGMSGDQMYPTIYMGYDDAGKFQTLRIRDYPRNSLVRCVATGAAFLLIHRGVLEAMRAAEFDRAFPFFMESSGHGKPVGEDITFCIRAGSLGFPVFVHTGVRIGHHKSALLTEEEFLKQLPVGLPPTVGLVIPTRGDHPDLLRGIIAASGLPPERVIVIDTRRAARWMAGAFVGVPDPIDVPGATVVVDGHTSINIHRWWNAGLDLLAERGCTHAAVLNDDLCIAPDTLPRLWRGMGGATLALATDDGTPSGHLFMLDLTHGVRPDESYRWYCGDLQLIADAEAARGVVRVPEAWHRHLHATEATEANPELKALAAADDALYDERHPPGSPHAAYRP